MTQLNWIEHLAGQERPWHALDFPECRSAEWTSHTNPCILIISYDSSPRRREGSCQEMWLWMSWGLDAHLIGTSPQIKLDQGLEKGHVEQSLSRTATIWTTYAGEISLDSPRTKEAKLQLLAKTNYRCSYVRARINPFGFYCNYSGTRRKACWLGSRSDAWIESLVSVSRCFECSEVILHWKSQWTLLGFSYGLVFPHYVITVMKGIKTEHRD